MEFKYLSDGKKVVVIGQLNNVESIVQEVFVTEGGDEIPSGEKFTTKNLHDEPVVSWEAKEEAKQKLRLNRVRDAIKQEEDKQSHVRMKLKGLEALFKQSTLLLESLEGQDLDTLISVMSGTCEYLVVGNYGVPELVKFDDGIVDKDDYGRFEALKLISLMGKTNGDLKYRINRYSDGSGSYDDAIPCNSIDEAKDIIRNIVISDIGKDRFPNMSDVKKLHKMGIVFDKNTADKIKVHVVAGHQSSIERSAENHEAVMKKYDTTKKEIAAMFADNPLS